MGTWQARGKIQVKPFPFDSASRPTHNRHMTESQRKPPTPYFGKTVRGPEVSGAGPDVLFVDFLARLHGAARVEIDPHQEMLIMALRARCLKHALSVDSDRIVPALNQLCAIYQKASVRCGLKFFQVFRAFYEEYVKVQEQTYLERKQARAKGQRPVQETNNLLNHVHDLLEGLVRRLATLGTFSLDVLSARRRASDLTPTQYVDLSLREKHQSFTEHPSVLAGTRDILFGSVRHDFRNAIAHRRYEIQEDGAAMLYDFHPRTKQRVEIGRIPQDDLRNIIDELELAIDVFEISLLIFQHNHGMLLNQLGYYGTEKDHSDKEMVEMLHLEAPASFLSVEDVAIEGTVVKVSLKLAAFDRTEASEAFVRSKDRNGNPIEYRLPIPPRRISARDQTFRFLQRASFYCRRYEEIDVQTADLDGTKIGEAAAPMQLLLRSTKEAVAKEDFLKGLIKNTFPSD